MSGVRVGVVGAGPMGRLHARAIARRAEREGDCSLSYVIDNHPGRSASLAGEFGGEAGGVLADCLAKIDVAAIAVPTDAHLDVALELMSEGIDVLVEKPIAHDAAGAERLVAAAARQDRLLGVGHAEWFQPTLGVARVRAGMPKSIRVERYAPASLRGLDIDVIQDVMIHDLDWVSRAVGRGVTCVRAEGTGLDQAQVELEFEGGALARLCASRVHTARVRKLWIEGDKGKVSADLLEKEVDGIPISAELLETEPLDLLWQDFLSARRDGRAPENSGLVGLATLELVDRVRAAMSSPDRS